MPAFENTGILSVDPLVTFTKRHLPTPLGLVGAWPELFRGRSSLNLISACWTLHRGDIAEIAREWKRVSSLLPEAMIVFLANTDLDAARLSAAGVPSITANSTILVDERIFKPLPAFNFSDAKYGAIYNARFEPYKRHELARLVDNLALLYDAQFDGSAPPHEARIREHLPRANYLNHRHGGGVHVVLDKTTVTREINASRCGLCLSAEEGAMRASMEYLLCGIPVVSTESTGGRDRYYQEPFAIVVPDSPEAVRDAVVEIAARNLNKLAIREHIGRIVEFERRNLLSAVNAIGREHFGRARLFEEIGPFLRAHPFTAPGEGWSRKRLLPVAQTFGIALPPADATTTQPARHTA
ncbi:MAG: hypothetical protein ABSC92_06205 [Rhizomicrobium sp.]|jgi:hypothetical protein